MSHLSPSTPPLQQDPTFQPALTLVVTSAAAKQLDTLR
jgi:hypothetical protein